MRTLTRLVYISLVATLTLLFSGGTSFASQSLGSGAYFCGTDGSCKWNKPGDPDWVFSRFTYIMGYAECPNGIGEWRSKSPGCRLILYTSGTDMPAYTGSEYRNYNAGKKSTWIRERLTQLGDNSETAYLHFYEDTKLRNWNGSSYDTLLIRGTYSMTISAKDSVSRVPNSYVNYLFMAGNTYENPARLSPNLSSPRLRQAYKEYLCQIFDQTGDNEHWVGKTGYWDGVYFDNYSPLGMKGSNLVSGGKVVESGSAPGNLLTFASDAYADWTWSIMQVFGREVRDTLQMADIWSVDHKKKYLAYNVGQTYKSSYLNPDSSGADALNYEFGWDPVYCNNSSFYRLENLHTRDSIAVRNGATSFWTSPPRKSYGAGSTTAREAIYNNLCFYYVARAESTWIYMRPSSGNAYGAFLNSGFDTLSWVPAMEQDLGAPTQHYQLAASGSSPDLTGGTYKVWSRQYPNGKVFIRPVDGFDAKWGTQSTAVTVNLGGSFKQLLPDGSFGPVVTQLSLRGGAGAIMYPATGSGGQCTTPPTVPTINSPVIGAEVTSIRPTLCINSSTQTNCSQAIRYDFQVSTSSTFSSITQENAAVAHTAGTSCWTLANALAAGTTYYWRVRSGNGTVWSNWSATGRFITPNAVPSTPTPNSPAGGASVLSLQPTLVINNSTDPEGTTLVYEFQVARGSSFSPVVAQGTNITQGANGTTSWQVSSSLANSTTHYWRSRAYDGVNYSGWSTARTFIVSAQTSNTPPTTPTINSPSNGSDVNSLTPSLRVNNSTDANGNTITYQFEILETATGRLLQTSPMITQGSPGTTAWTAGAGLVNNTRYRWRARAYDGIAWSSYMTNSEFRVLLGSNSAPTVPVAMSPINGQSVVGATIVFVINNAYDADGDDMRYSFRIFSDSLGATQLELSDARDETQPYTYYYSTGNYANNRHYWWSVRAYDGTSFSSWSPLHKFLHYDAILDVDDVARVVSPADGSEELTAKPTFRASWNSNIDTIPCLFEVSSDSEFSDLYDAGVVVGIEGQAAWVPNRSLAGESTYYWRARLANGGYSERAMFTVNSQIFASPNPFSYLDGELTFHNLPEGSRIEIYTPSGEKVAHFDGLGGDFHWDAMNTGGEKLGSGVFLYYVISGNNRYGDKLIIVR